jgi:ABC-type uncharacterized transport system involved in gliding motility auxiliary subunit
MQKLDRFLRANSEFILSLGLIGIFVPLIVYFIRQQFTVPAQIIFVIGFVLLGLYVALEYRRILAALSGRRVRFGGNAVAATLIFLGIIVLLAFLSQRYSKRMDLTASQSFSVSEQTIKVLDNLSQPVKIWAFLRPAASPQTEPLLKSYAASSKGKLTYELIDPDARPTLARQYGLADDETDILVIEQGNTRQKTAGYTESDITTALVKAMSGTPKVVYLMSGHGERSSEDTGKGGILMAKQALEKDNYTVKTLNLLAGPDITTTTAITVSGGLTSTAPARRFGSIPADAAAIIIMSPQTPLLDGEWQIVSEWLNKGGKLFVLQDAMGSPTGLEDMLLANWGLRTRNDFAIDPLSSYLGDPATLWVQSGEFSPITRNMRAAPVMPGARSIDATQSPQQGTTMTALGQTTEGSWGETDFASSVARPDQGKDAIGPLTVAQTAERDAPGGKARLALFGNSVFATDAYINAGGNMDFFLNTVNWLTEDAQLMAIRARQPEQRALFVPPTQARALAFGFVLGLPLIVLGLGAVVWWRRR